MDDLKNIKKLQRLFNLMDEDALTKEDFLSAFRQVIDFIKQREQMFVGNLKELNAVVEKIKSDISHSARASKEEVKQTAKNAINDILTKNGSSLREMEMRINQRLAEIKDGEDADEEITAEMVAQKYVVPLSEELKASFKTHEQYMTEVIEMFQKKLLELEDMIKTQPRGRFGGGTSAIGVASALGTAVRKETPSGDIDGVNVTYTVPKPINAVLSFAINGQAITDNEYAVSGNTITFTTPIPASLAGTSFRIVYV